MPTFARVPCDLDLIACRVFFRVAGVLLRISAAINWASAATASATRFSSRLMNSVSVTNHPRQLAFRDGRHVKLLAPDSLIAVVTLTAM